MLTTFLIVSNLALAIWLVYFYVQYRFDAQHINHFVKRGELKYLNRYAKTLNLKYLQEAFSYDKTSVPEKSSLKLEKFLSHPFFAPIFNSFTFPFFVLNKEKEFVFMNQSFMDLFQMNEFEEGLTLSSMIRNPHLMDAIDQAMQKPSEHHVMEFSMGQAVLKDYEAHISYLTPEQKKSQEELASYIFVFMIDLTLMKRTEKMRSDFVAHAGHELKTPLTSLIGYIETLQEQKSDKKTQVQFLEIMYNQSQRMLNLINDLISLTKIEVEESSAPTELCSLTPLIQNVIDTLDLQAQKRGIKVQFDKPDFPLVTQGDQEQLIQVFQNLIYNSIQYSFENSRIEITAKRIEASWVDHKLQKRFEIILKDQSPGIEARHLPRLTERFYRVDIAKSKKAGGTGLGLAIVKHILKRHQGELLIESQIEVGSEFIVILPEADEAE